MMAVIIAVALFATYLITSCLTAIMVTTALAVCMFVLWWCFGDDRVNAMKAMLVFLVLGIVVLIFNAIATENAKVKTLRIAEACEAYKVVKGHYPMKLSEVAGEHPLAKPTVMWGGFHYVDKQIYFIPDPTMPVPAYDLATKKWTAISLFGGVDK
jgi:hypothetical protein